MPLVLKVLHAVPDEASAPTTSHSTPPSPVIIAALQATASTPLTFCTGAAPPESGPVQLRRVSQATAHWPPQAQQQRRISVGDGYQVSSPRISELLAPPPLHPHAVPTSRPSEARPTSTVQSRGRASSASHATARASFSEGPLPREPYAPHVSAQAVFRRSASDAAAGGVRHAAGRDAALHASRTRLPAVPRAAESLPRVSMSSPPRSLQPAVWPPPALPARQRRASMPPPLKPLSPQAPHASALPLAAQPLRGVPGPPAREPAPTLTVTVAPPSSEPVGAVEHTDVVPLRPPPV